MTAPRTLDLAVGPVSITLSRAGNPAWPDPAHRLVSLSVRGARLVHGVCGYLSDYRVAGGPWDWAGMAHGGEVQEEELEVSRDEPGEREVLTRAVLSVADASGAHVPVVRRAILHRLRALHPRAVEYERVDALQSLADHEQRIEYLDMVPLSRTADGGRAWFGWSSEGAVGEVAEAWTMPARRQDLGPSRSVLATGPRAGLVRESGLPPAAPTTRVVDRPTEVKLYAVGLDAQSLGDPVRSVAEGELRVIASRWVVLA